MKVYHQKNFLIGALLLLLGVLAIAVGIWKGFTIYLVALAVLLLALGIRMLVRSLSKADARRDRINEQDERNQLVLLKARSAAFRTAQIICALCLAAGSLGCYFLWETELFFLCFGFCLGLGLTLSVMRSVLFIGFLSAEQNT